MQRPIRRACRGVGDHAPVPEVSGVWDPLSRWTESSRWRWREEEHNNILEARAGLSSAALVVQQPSAWGSRVLLISDSQVTIGAFAKGRSSVGVLNMLCRRVAALSFACRVKFHWRYIRTHRNHADGPSRGHPLGVAPKEDAPITPVPAAEDWKKLPELNSSTGRLGADRRTTRCVQWPSPQDSEQAVVALVAERACGVSQQADSSRKG